MVAADTRLTILRNCSLFSRIPWETLQELAERAHERRFAPGAQIVRQGEAASGLFVIRASKYCFCSRISPVRWAT